MLVMRVQGDGPARGRGQDDGPLVEVEGEAARQPEDGGGGDDGGGCDQEAGVPDANVRSFHHAAKRVGSAARRGMASMANQTVTASRMGSGVSGHASSPASATTTSQARCPHGGSSRMNNQAAPTRIAKSCRCQ